MGITRFWVCYPFLHRALRVCGVKPDHGATVHAGADRGPDVAAAAGCAGQPDATATDAAVLPDGSPAAVLRSAAVRDPTARAATFCAVDVASGRRAWPHLRVRGARWPRHVFPGAAGLRARHAHYRELLRPTRTRHARVGGSLRIAGRAHDPSLPVIKNILWRVESASRM